MPPLQVKPLVASLCYIILLSTILTFLYLNMRDHAHYTPLPILTVGNLTIPVGTMFYTGMLPVSITASVLPLAQMPTLTEANSFNALFGFIYFISIFKLYLNLLDVRIISGFGVGLIIVCILTFGKILESLGVDSERRGHFNIFYAGVVSFLRAALKFAEDVIKILVPATEEEEEPITGMGSSNQTQILGQVGGE